MRLLAALIALALLAVPQPVRLSDSGRGCILHLPSRLAPLARQGEFFVALRYEVTVDGRGKPVRISRRDSRLASADLLKAVENGLRGWNITPPGRYEVGIGSNNYQTVYEVCRPNRRDCVRLEPRPPCPVFDGK